MAAAFKTSKSELVAIYRLEFYKKQKNWKFCTTERKKEEERRKAAKKAKAKLNQTYSIEPAPERDTDTAGTETEEVKLEKDTEKVQLETDEQKEDTETIATEERTDNLNEAFVDTETDDNATTPIADTPPTGPYSPKWSIQQWAARCRPWNCESTYPPQFVQNDPKQHHVQSDPSQLYVTRDTTEPYHPQGQVLGQVLTDYETDLLYNRKDMPRCDTNLPHGANVLDVAKLRGCEQLGGYEGCEQGWPRQTQVWTNRQGGWFEEICDIPEEAIEAMEALEVAEADTVDGAGGEWGLLQRAGDWLGSAEGDKVQVAMCRSDSLPSLSSGSFCRGAALAPHSTELDLAGAGAGGQREGAGAGGPEEGAGALSAPALAHAVAAHAAALHALLSEARRRDLQVSPPPVGQLYSFDEYPTRDLGPAAPPPPPCIHTPSPSSVYMHNPTIVNDMFVAGSFKNRPDLRGQTEDVGRGRGRKVRVIGIEMGRPYRL